MSTPAPRRPRAQQDASQQGRLAPAFDRDALALSYLHEKGHLTRAEFRDNLRALGVRLTREDIKLPDPPQIRSIAPPAQVTERETEPPPEDGEEPWDPWDDEQEDDSDA